MEFLSARWNSTKLRRVKSKTARIHIAQVVSLRFEVFTGFKVYGVYLVGSTVAIGFFRHSCWRIHDTAALQEVRIQFRVDRFQKMGFWSPGFGAKYRQMLYQAKLCDVQPMFNTQWVLCFERAGFMFSGLQTS